VEKERLTRRWVAPGPRPTPGGDTIDAASPGTARGTKGSSDCGFTRSDRRVDVGGKPSIVKVRAYEISQAGASLP
jgi:hypothetical protein